MQTNDSQYEVIIVGGGIVGLSCALALSQNGFQVALIEAQSQPIQEFPKSSDAYDSKVVAITRASEYFFERINVWSFIQSSRTCAYAHMKVWDSVMDGLIEFSAVDFFENNLGHIIEQRVILAALWQVLKQQSNMTIFTGLTVEKLHHHPDYIVAVLSNDISLKTKLVIACDGANSTLRDMCQITTTGWDYQQSAIVATVEGTQSHYHTAFQRFALDGPLALLPLAHPCQSSIVWTTTPDEAQMLMQALHDDFAKTLTREVNAVMGQMRLIGKRYLFPLKTHHANHYVVPRCVLVGDAAHTLHPLAGQGVNLGLLDVASLVEILLNAKVRLRDIGCLSILKKYERKRRLHNQIMIWSMEFFKQGFGSTSSMLQRLRNIGLSWVNSQVSIKQIFAKMALGTLGPIPLLAQKLSEGNSHVKKDGPF